MPLFVSSICKLKPRPRPQSSAVFPPSAYPNRSSKKEEVRGGDGRRLSARLQPHYSEYYHNINTPLTTIKLPARE